MVASNKKILNFLWMYIILYHYISSHRQFVQGDLKTVKLLSDICQQLSSTFRVKPLTKIMYEKLQSGFTPKLCKKL
jgi:hypothetical protein